MKKPSPDTSDDRYPQTSAEIILPMMYIIDAMSSEGVPGTTQRACIAALISVAHILHHMYVKADDSQ